MSEDKSHEFRKLLLINTGLSLAEIQNKVTATIDRMKGFISEETALMVILKEYNMLEENIMAETHKKGVIGALFHKNKEGAQLVTKKGTKYAKMTIIDDVSGDTIWVNIFDKENEFAKGTRVLFDVEQRGNFYDLKYIAEDTAKETIHPASDVSITNNAPVKAIAPSVIANKPKAYIFMTEEELLAEYPNETTGVIHGHIENLILQKQMSHTLAQIRDTGEKQLRFLENTFSKLHTDIFDMKQAILETKTHLENYEKIRGTVDDCLRKTIDLTKTISKQKTAKKTAEGKL